MMPTLGDEIAVALTFDLDPDHFDPTIGPDYGSSVLGWRGVETGVPALAEILSVHRDDFGGRACATWLPRADNQIAAIYGNNGEFLDRFDTLLRSLDAAGDEIAWHPHLHRNDSDAWVQETDPATLEDILISAHRALRERGWTPRATRMGGNYGSNALMAILEGLGIEVDSSAMPSRQKHDNHYDFDWSETPRAAYRPARNDYRVPGEPAHKLVEIPMSMAEVKADYDDRPYPRYVDLSFHPHTLQPGLDALLENASYLITDTHPSTVLPEIASETHGLLSFSLDAFKENLEAILQICARRARPVRFVTLSDPRLRPA